MTNRTLNLVHHIFNAREEQVKVIYNTWCQEPRKAESGSDPGQTQVLPRSDLGLLPEQAEYHNNVFWTDKSPCAYSMTISCFSQ